MKRLKRLLGFALFVLFAVYAGELGIVRHDLRRESGTLSRRLEILREQDKNASLVIANALKQKHNEFSSKKTPALRFTAYSSLGIPKNSTLPSIPTYQNQTRWVAADGQLWLETIFTGTTPSSPSLGISIAVPKEFLKTNTPQIVAEISTRAPRGFERLLTQRVALPGDEALSEGNNAFLAERFSFGGRQHFLVFAVSLFLIFLFMRFLRRRAPRISKRELQLQEELSYLSRTYQDLAKNLETEREKIESILNSAPDGIFSCMPDGKIIFWNHSMENLTGLAPENALGKYHGDLLTVLSETGQMLVEPFSQCSSEGKTLSFSDCRLEVRSQDQNFPVVMSAAPVKHSDGAVGEVVVTIKDIRQQKEAEQMKKDLHSMITHDLRSPLSAMLGYADLIRNPKMWKSEGDRQKYVNSLLRSGKTMMMLISNLLEWAGTESGKLLITKEPVALRPVLREVVDNLSILAKPKNIDIDLIVPPQLTALSDAERLKQICLNLLSNAIKFSRADGKITVSAYETEENACISIADSGPGIPPEDRENLFEKFSRLRKKGSGTGLGLYIVKTLVQALDGHIEVASEENVGSTFVISLPVPAKAPVHQSEQLTMELSAENQETVELV